MISAVFVWSVTLGVCLSNNVIINNILPDSLSGSRVNTYVVGLMIILRKIKQNWVQRECIIVLVGLRGYACVA